MLEFDLLIMAGLLALSAFFSGVETALVSINKVKARQLAKTGTKAAILIEEFKENPHKMLSAILIGNNVVNIAATALATSIAMQVFESNAIGIAIGIMTFLILIFGEITPKSIAVQNAETIGLIAIRPIKLLTLILSPLIFILGGVRNIIMRVVGSREPDPMTEQDVRTMVVMGAEAGAIDHEEKEMIRRIFEFNDIDVEEVMTPRVEIKALPATAKLKDLSDFLAETPYSRIPVYKGKLDNIVGIFFIRDAWEYMSGKKSNIQVGKIARPALFVPKTRKIDKQLAEFQREHTHIAMVVDDYGGVIGIVTMEDLLEEIVGEIVDESDEVFGLKKLDMGIFEANGKVALKHINKTLGTRWQSEDFDTISGFMIEKLDRLPEQNEELTVGKFTLIASKVRAPKIHKIKIVKNGIALKK